MNEQVVYALIIMFLTGFISGLFVNNLYNYIMYEQKVKELIGNNTILSHITLHNEHEKFDNLCKDLNWTYSSVNDCICTSIDIYKLSNSSELLVCEYFADIIDYTIR